MDIRIKGTTNDLKLSCSNCRVNDSLFQFPADQIPAHLLHFYEQHENCEKKRRSKVAKETKQIPVETHACSGYEEEGC